jgi:hypothetical protein
VYRNHRMGHWWIDIFIMQQPLPTLGCIIEKDPEWLKVT